jgi:hypothetical protein
MSQHSQYLLEHCFLARADCWLSHQWQVQGGNDRRQ